jgi:general stress protein 26
LSQKNDGVEKLRAMVKDIQIAMMTTRRPDGHLVSRPMSLQEKTAPGADFWFVADRNSEKLAELRFDPHVNLGFYKDRTREWVSVAGTAVLTDERALIRRLYLPDWKAWFDDDGTAAAGTRDDPRMFLIGVKAHSAHFMTVDKPQPVVLFEVVKGMITGDSPDIGAEHQVSGAEIRRRS